MPPLKKGAYCYAAVGRYVGRSVGRSVDQNLSAQYLLTPSFDQVQTWCRGCSQWDNDLDWLSGHMFKGQYQTTLLSPVCCPYLLFPCLPVLASDKLCFYREYKPVFCIIGGGGIYVFYPFVKVYSMVGTWTLFNITSKLYRGWDKAWGALLLVTATV